MLNDQISFGKIKNMPSPLTNEIQAKSEETIDFDAIKALTETESKAVDKLILDELSSEVVLINQIGRYIINNGGKRLRPMLVLLAAKSLGYQGSNHLIMAAVIEFIHTATLLHDDVVDESILRRGQDSANAVWGNSASVLVGDYLYSRSFEMMVRADNMRIMEILSKTTTAIAEGEVLQLLNCNNPETTEKKYLDVISRKTAILFSTASQLGGVLCNANKEIENSLLQYGHHLGIAFQLIDDALDYKADASELGKNTGDDLADGKPTLPLIFAMQECTSQQNKLIKNAIQKGNRQAFNEVYTIIQSTNALNYTEQRAEQEAIKAVAALGALPNSTYKDAMVSLAKFSLQRDY